MRDVSDDHSNLLIEPEDCGRIRVVLEKHGFVYGREGLHCISDYRGHQVVQLVV